MDMKKSILRIALVLISSVILLSFTACSGSSNGGSVKRMEPSEIKEKTESAVWGDKIVMGAWEGEALSWTVICQHVGKALMICDKVVDKRVYNEKRGIANWKDSDVRSWLNGEFYDKAFNDGEKELVLMSALKTRYTEDYKFYYTETEDHVFLLSVSEFSKYLMGKGASAFGVPIEALAKKKPYMSEVKGVEGVEKGMTWWLRDGSDESGYACDVAGYDAKYSTYGNEADNSSGVRPAMWIVYDGEFMKEYEEGKTAPRADEALDAKLKELKAGDVFTFGRYDINPRVSDGYEDTSWVVLEDAGDYLFITLNAPIVSYYYQREPFEGDLTWAKSELRQFINDEEFLNELFTPQEKAKLQATQITTEGDEMWKREGGDDTVDRLFLLSKAEVEKYFPTAEEQVLGEGVAYWLRNPSFVDSSMAYVFPNGGFGSGDHTDYHVVRLAAWISR